MILVPILFSLTRRKNKNKNSVNHSNYHFNLLMRAFKIATNVDKNSFYITIAII